jgi:hypothetical protein
MASAGEVWPSENVILRNRKPSPVRLAAIKTATSTNNFSSAYHRYLSAAESAIKPRIAQTIIIPVVVIAPVPWSRWLEQIETAKLTRASKVPRKNCCSVRGPTLVQISTRPMERFRGLRRPSSPASTVPEPPVPARPKPSFCDGYLLPPM